jgi:hypothetical protein
MLSYFVSPFSCLCPNLVNIRVRVPLLVAMSWPHVLRDLACYVPWPLDEHGWEETDLLKLNRSGRYKGARKKTRNF